MSASVTLAATATAAYTGWSATGGTAVFTVSTSDGNTSYMRSSAGAAAKESYTFDPLPAGAEKINTLSVVGEIINTVGGGAADIRLFTRAGGTDDLSMALFAPTTSYVDHTFAPTLDPLGFAWTPTTVNALEAGIHCSDTNTSNRITFLRTVVSFEYGAGGFAMHMASVAGAALGLAELIKLGAWLARTTGVRLSLNELRRELHGRRVYV